ncbi:MAG TPA: hypothetical protein PLT86_00255 [Candidatus Latescibacteria bacterium]|nr:hypothetical protein [Candidatus Latescibacterota bacterium]
MKSGVRRLSLLFVVLPLGAVLMWSAWVVAAAGSSLRIFYTASVKGYIDQCGCRYNPTGGIGRRATFIQRNTDGAIPMILLDGGDVIGEESPVERMQTTYLFRAMKEMGYRTIGVGPRDFAYGIAYLREAERTYGFTFTCANLVDDATGRTLFAPHVVERVSGKGGFRRNAATVRVGVVNVMGQDRLPLTVPSDPILRVTPPVPAVQNAVATLRPQTDVIVVMVYGTQQLLDSVRAVPGVGAVLATRPLRLPDQWVSFNRTNVVGYSSFQGRGVGKIDISLAGPHRITSGRGEMAMMTADIPDQPRMAELKREFEAWKERNAGGDR